MGNVAERMNPLSDVVFSWMFQDMESAEAAWNLINSILVAAGEKKIGKIKEIHSQYQQSAEYPDGKYGRLDVKAETEDGEKVDTEVQLTTQPFFIDRELFYGERVLTEDLKSGDSYKNMPKVTLIALADFLVREDNKEIVQPIKVMYTLKPIRQATEKLKMIIVQLPRFREAYKTFEDVKGKGGRDGALLQWLYVLTKGYQSKEEMDMAEAMTAGMANFNALYNRAIADQKLRDRYEYELSAALDRNSALEAAEEIGKEAQARESALNMYKDGLSVDKISAYIGYAVDVVKEWVENASK